MTILVTKAQLVKAENIPVLSGRLVSIKSVLLQTEMEKLKVNKEEEIENLKEDIERIKNERDESLAILNEDMKRVKLDYQVRITTNKSATHVETA